VVIFNEQASVAESDEDKPGITLDYDAAGNLVSLEVLDASQRVTEAKKIEFQTTG
jgi:YD repeat-containing protein